MADEAQGQPNQTTDTQADNLENKLPQEIHDQMQLSLSGGIMAEVKKIEDEQTVTPIANDAPQQPAFSFDIFKDKFGYEKPEDIEKEISELRAFKAAPTQAAAEIKFENEDSKKYFEAIQAGKVDELLEFYQQQKVIDNLILKEVTKDTAPEIIKLSLKIENKDLTDKEIEHRFKRLYGQPKEPVQGAEELDEDFAIKHSEWKESVESAETDLIIDAKVAKPKLESAKTKLVFPNIESANPQYQEFLQYQKDLAEETKLNTQKDAETKDAYKSIKAEQIKYTTNFKDEANKIDFNFEFVPETDGFAKTIETVTDFNNKFLASYLNQDGTPNRSKFLEDIYFAQNKDKIILSAMNQAKNATIKSMLPDNSGGGLTRFPVLPEGEKSEFQKQMEASLSMGSVRN